MFLKKALEGKNEWWRYVLLFFATFSVLLGVNFITLTIAEKMYPEWNPMDMLNSDSNFINLNVLLLVNILPFVVCFFFLLFGFQKLHLKPWMNLFDTVRELNWIRFFKFLGIFILVFIVLETISFFIEPENYSYQYAGGDFWILVLVALVFFPFQAGLEELIFRSYLLQGLALLFNNRLLAIVISSLLFAGMHMANPEVLQYGYLNPFLYYFLTGIFLCVLVVMEGNIYMAWAFHTANNMVAAVLVSYKGAAVQTYALFGIVELDLSNMLIQAVISYSILLFIIGKIRKWSSWDSLWGPIGTNNIESLLDEEYQ